MKKLTVRLIALTFLLCAFTAPAIAEINLSIPSFGEPCSSDLDCAIDENCINDICIPSAGEPCTNDLDCTLGGACIEAICVPSIGDPCSNDMDCGPDGSCISDICVPSLGEPCTNDLQCDFGELCIDEICQEAECETNEDCEEGLVCDNASSFMCVECLSDANCLEGEFCADNNTCELFGNCDLRIKPRRININKKKNPDLVYKKLKFRGNENFVIPLNDDGNLDSTQCDFGPLNEGAVEIRTQRNVLQIVMSVDSETDTGFYQIRIGSCVGEIQIYDKKAAKAAKKAAKAAAKAAKKAAQ